MQHKIADSLESLMKPNFIRFLPHLLGDWIAIFAGFAVFAAWPTVVTFLVASIVIGISQHALFILGHDGVHYSMAKNRNLSEWVSRLFCLFPLGVTVSSYREFHFAHHRNTKEESDPELSLLSKIGNNWRPPFTLTRAMKLWALSFFGFCLKDQLVILRNMPSGCKKEKAYLLVFTTVVLFAAIRTHHLVYLGLWQFSLLTSNLSTFRIETWYEHSLNNGTTNRYQIPNMLYRLLVPHNIWVHYEHHKYPNIPFYNLEKVRLIDQNGGKIYSFAEMVEALAEQEQQNAPMQPRIAA